MVRAFVFSILAAGIATPATAQMDLMTMQRASGLAQIMARSSSCQFDLDQSKLDAYLQANGLDTPETLSFISSSVQTADLLGAPTPSDCTLARTTARSIGVLAQP